MAADRVVSGEKVRGNISHACPVVYRYLVVLRIPAMAATNEGEGSGPGRYLAGHSHARRI